MDVVPGAFRNVEVLGPERRCRQADQDSNPYPFDAFPVSDPFRVRDAVTYAFRVRDAVSIAFCMRA